MRKTSSQGSNNASIALSVSRIEFSRVTDAFPSNGSDGDDSLGNSGDTIPANIAMPDGGVINVGEVVPYTTGLINVEMSSVSRTGESGTDRSSRHSSFTPEGNLSRANEAESSRMAMPGVIMHYEPEVQSWPVCGA